MDRVYEEIAMDRIQEYWARVRAALDAVERYEMGDPWPDFDVLEAFLWAFIHSLPEGDDFRGDMVTLMDLAQYLMDEQV